MRIIGEAMRRGTGDRSGARYHPDCITSLAPHADLPARSMGVARRPFAALGEAHGAICDWLGMSERDVTGLKDDGVI